MCKTLFISEGPSRFTIEEKFKKAKDEPKKFDNDDAREKYVKEEEIYFTTLGLGKITGTITALDYQSDGVLVVTLRVKRIDQDEVHTVKEWKAYYDPHTKKGMFYYKE